MLKTGSPTTSGMLALTFALLAASCLSFQQSMPSEKSGENSWPPGEVGGRGTISNPIQLTAYPGVSLAVPDGQNPIVSRIADDSPAQRAGLMADTVSHVIEEVRWLAGCWAGTLADGVRYEEAWLEPRASMMMGMARATRGGTAVSYEFMRITEESGTLVFAAQPSGRPATLFVATSIGTREAVFENQEHNFPQRIRYSLTEANTLNARIEGVVQGEHKAVDFPLERSDCPGAHPPRHPDSF